MLGLGQVGAISFRQKPLFQGRPQRTTGTLAETIDRSDPFLVFSAEISAEPPQNRVILGNDGAVNYSQFFCYYIHMIVLLCILIGRCCAAQAGQ